MLSNVLKGRWKDDYGSRRQRTEARWPWRMEVFATVREYEPNFPQQTFDRRWRLIESALESLHDADKAPHRALEVALIILGDAHTAPGHESALALSTARRLARRYFAPYDHFFSWLED